MKLIKIYGDDPDKKISTTTDIFGEDLVLSVEVQQANPEERKRMGDILQILFKRIYQVRNQEFQFQQKCENTFIANFRKFT